MKKRIKRYLDLLKSSNCYLGDFRKDEIEIVVYPDIIERIERIKREEGASLPFQGQVPHWMSGIISVDKFFMYLRDPVIFPDNTFGLYDRVLYTNEIKGVGGICILPITPDNELILNVVFRHSARCFSVEAPGTISVENENFYESIRRCMNMELGVDSQELTIKELGFVMTERGLIGTRIPVCAAEIDKPGNFLEPKVRRHIKMSISELHKQRQEGKIVIDGRECLSADAYTDVAISLLNQRKEDNKEASGE